MDLSLETWEDMTGCAGAGCGCVGCESGAGCCGVTDSVGGVSQEELESLNAAVANLNADVIDFHRRAKPEQLPSLGSFFARWNPFVVKWDDWYVNHQTFLSRQFVDPEFAEFRSRYEHFRQEWLQVGFTTDAPTAKEVAKASGETELWASVKDAILPIVGIVGGGIALYMFGPLLVSAVVALASSTRKAA